MDLKLLLQKKKPGDITLIAQMLTNKHGEYISSYNASKALHREGSKYHDDAVEALQSVVESREEILQN